ncbi:MAG: hypothetical protein KKE51_11845 [Gammaproteobacteria bacterium]|uniref:hypothetical protein n=1 Tax=Achromobacter ruhlandii TaxID=72557 RepID=UPI0011D84B0F|nr:hypothetical protein [Achromobacter ruhlandii]MBU1364503.1 hypothetical protein [Gammaproteobacteria bacterium]TXT28023.1 MAG: hypothetical protein FD131_3403 [Rhodocyclaceae bacterium]MBU1601987.1 hypothetical protein [Gammaproteobacteria bacterium]MBU2433964.1 hypothetical protein [Gammaproteobacteria bacterium]MBU2447788.1 hypothetical protein [Gammaproteobacteria bacterium]
MPPTKDKLRPTVIGAPGASLRTPAGAAPRAQDVLSPARRVPAATPVVRQPTAIPGAERKRIEVAVSDLQALSPGAAAGVYQQARALVGAFVVDKASQRKAILWGHNLQQAHGDLVTEMLALARSPVLRQVEGYLARMMDILGSIDLMAVCGHGGDSLVGRLFQGINSRIDTPGELAQAQAELEQLLALMGGALDPLLDLKDRLLRLSGSMEGTAAQVEASAIGALFLSERLRQDDAALAQCFVERSMSLTQTLAQMRQAGSTREMQIEQPIRLIGAIQNVALVVMPAFIGSIASIATLTASKTTISPTEAGELAYRLRDIISQLKP